MSQIQIVKRLYRYWWGEISAAMQVKSAKDLLAERMMGDEVQRLDAVGEVKRAPDFASHQPLGAVHSVAHCQLITGLCPDAVLRSPRLQQETMTDLGVSQMQSSFAYPHLAHSCSCLTALIELSQTGRGPRWFI